MGVKIDPVIRRETGHITVWLLVTVLLTQVVFWLIGCWHYSVLLGSVLGSVTAIGNFLLLGHMIQKALTQDEKKAANTVRISQGGRLLMQGLILVVAAVLPWFNIWSAAIPLLIPRIAVSIRASRNKDSAAPAPAPAPDPDDDPYDDDED